MITFNGVDDQIHVELALAGYIVLQVDNAHEAYDLSGAQSAIIDANAQVIINNYNPIIQAKKAKIAELKQEAAKRANAIYGFLSGEDDETDASDVQAFYNFAVDIYTSIIPAARDTLAPRLQSFKDIRDTAVSSVSAINALTTYEEVLAYDVVNNPVWP